MAEDPYLVFVLGAISIPARNAFGDDHNSGFYKFVPVHGEAAAGCSRASTPATNTGNDGYDSEDSTQDSVETWSEHQLQFTLERKPRNPEVGWLFGSDKKKCDVVLGTPKEGISGVHFRITYNDTAQLVLIDQSTHGTAVSYGTRQQARYEKRRNPSNRQRGVGQNPSNDFSWILFPEVENKRVIIGHMIAELPYAPVVEFSVEIATHAKTGEQHSALKAAYIEEMRSTIPFDIDIDSRLTTAGHTSPHSPQSRRNQRTVWLDGEEIGHGQFATVHKTVNVSTGTAFAAKVLLCKRVNIRQRWEREVKILRNISHSHIVSYEDHDTTNEFPRLVMEYLPLGNLAQQNAFSRLDKWESATLIVQALDALAYMHPQKITHRDLKPENILVSAREQGRIFDIKLADLGLATDEPDMTTICGTSLYLSPEIFEGTPYTDKVDIWSLGIIGLQYKVGLPRFSPNDGSWYSRVVETAASYSSDILVNLLSSWMLRINPEERLSAAKCLCKALEILAETSPTPVAGIDPETPTEAMSSSIIMKGPRERAHERGRDEQKTVDLADFPSFPIVATGSMAEAKSAFEVSDWDEDLAPGDIGTTPGLGRTKRRRLEATTVRQDDQPQTSWAQWQKAGPLTAEPGYIRMTVEKCSVSMRTSDYFVSATDLMRLACSGNADRIRIRKLFREHAPRVEVLGRGASTQMWVPFQDGRFLSQYLSLEAGLQPLFQYGQTKVTAQEPRPNYFMGQYLQIEVAQQHIVCARRSDFWLNATHILRAGDLDPQQQKASLQDAFDRERVRGNKREQGLYVSPTSAFALCAQHDLHDMRITLETALKAEGYQYVSPWLSEVEDDSFLPVMKGSYA